MPPRQVARGVANQSSNAATSFEFLALEFKKLPNREIHEIREKEMKKICEALLTVFDTFYS